MTEQQKKYRKTHLKKVYKLICILMSEISIDPFAKHGLVLVNHRGQMFLVVGLQVCTHLRRDFVPLLFADLLQVIKVSRQTLATRTFSSFHRLSHEMKVWRDLNVLHPETLLCLPCPCVLGQCHAGIIHVNI